MYSRSPNDRIVSGYIYIYNVYIYIYIVYIVEVP